MEPLGYSLYTENKRWTRGISFMKQYLLTPPHALAAARGWDLPLGHMAFQIGPEGHLHQAALPPEVTGGLMLVGLAEPPAGDTPPRQAVQEILSVCQARAFLGVVLDLETPPSPYIAQLITALQAGLRRSRRGLFLPESYANFSSQAILYLSSALSGGSLRQRLQTAVETYGADRLALSLHRASADFFLPSPTGEGRPLSQQALRQRMARLEPRVHFSQDLCAHYFTYMSRETGAHFVLFDDEESLRSKRALAQEVGIQRFFWLYPEVEEFLSQLVDQKETHSSLS